MDPEEGRPGRSSAVVPGTTLDQVVALYEFDRRLKATLLDAVERVEVAVRAQVAYRLGAIDGFAHVDPGNFDPRFTARRAGHRTSLYEEWCHRLTEQTHRSKEDFVAHFARKYDGTLPIWVAIEVTDFGMVSRLYSALRRPLRDEIAARYEVLDERGRGNGAAMSNLLRVLNFTRNTCAHHARLWNRNFTDQVGVRALRTHPALAHLARLSVRDRARLYPALVVARHLMRVAAPDSSWGAELVDLVDQFPTDAVVSRTDMGLASDWRARLG